MGKVSLWIWVFLTYGLNSVIVHEAITCDYSLNQCCSWRSLHSLPAKSKTNWILGISQFWNPFCDWFLFRSLCAIILCFVFSITGNDCCAQFLNNASCDFMNSKKYGGIYTGLIKLHLWTYQLIYLSYSLWSRIRFFVM